MLFFHTNIYKNLSYYAQNTLLPCNMFAITYSIQSLLDSETCQKQEANISSSGERIRLRDTPVSRSLKACEFTEKRNTTDVTKLYWWDTPWCHNACTLSFTEGSGLRWVWRCDTLNAFERNLWKYYFTLKYERTLYEIFVQKNDKRKGGSMRRITPGLHAWQKSGKVIEEVEIRNQTLGEPNFWKTGKERKNLSRAVTYVFMYMFVKWIY